MGNFFIGNIMQRTFNETEHSVDEAFGEHGIYIVKKDAILYKTTKGHYVDVELLFTESDYIKADEMELEDFGWSRTDGAIQVLGSVSLSDVNNMLGYFIDSESLKPYNDFQLENEVKPKGR